MRGIVRGLTISALATIMAGAVVWLIAKATGSVAIGRAFDHVDAPWIIVVAAAELLTYPAYTIAYRSLAQVHGEEPMSRGIAGRIVVAGFGPFALLGGFGIDKQALAAVHDDEHGARVKVLALGALEWAVLAPVGCACAIVLLLQGSPIMGALLWPWAIAVPVGFTVAAWASSPDRAKRLSTFHGKTIKPLVATLDGMAALRTLVLHPIEYWEAWIGTTFYWAFDILSFYAAVRMFGIRLNLGAIVIAYASGYAITRRSLPLGGAGLTELLMTYSLYWVGASLAPALAAVLVYRLFNFVLVGVPAMIAQRQLERMLDAKLNPAPAVPEAISPRRVRGRVRGRFRSRARQ